MNKHVPAPPLEHEAAEAGSPGEGDFLGHPAANSREETRRDSQKPPAARKDQPHESRPPQARDANSSPAQPGTPPSTAPQPQPAASQPAATNPARTSIWTRPRLVIAGMIAAIIVLVAFLWWPGRGSDSKITYEIVPAARGTIIVPARATGTLVPRETADIVAPLAGRVQSVAVEAGERVTKGQVLARVVSDSARDDLLRAQTALVSDQANVARAEADIAEERAALARARNSGTPSAADSAQARLARAIADAEEARAVLRQDQDRLVQARTQIASLDLRAPFDGVVLKSTIQAGQEVRAATREAPLFTIAADLSQLKLQADFPESALGGLHPGDRAEFTTPAYPRRVFPALLTGLDLLPQKETKDGKESTYYRGNLSVANQDGALRPGMDANINVITAEARDVLVVPNAALNFTPPQNPKDAQSANPPLQSSPASQSVRRVWVMADGRLQARDVTLGLSDGRFTQIVAGPLRAGEPVVTGAIVKTSGGRT
jgi:HlyD family secretion protein